MMSILRRLRDRSQNRVQRVPLGPLMSEQICFHSEMRNQISRPVADVRFP